MLHLSLLLISLLTGTSVAGPVSFDYDTFDFNQPLTPSPGPILDGSNLQLSLYPSEGEGVPDFTVSSPQQQHPVQQQIDYPQQQPQFVEFKIATEEAAKTAEEPDYASCTKVCCEGHYGEILTFSTGETGFDYVNRCSARPSTFWDYIFLLSHWSTPSKFVTDHPYFISQLQARNPAGLYHMTCAVTESM